MKKWSKIIIPVAFFIIILTSFLIEGYAQPSSFNLFSASFPGVDQAPGIFKSNDAVSQLQITDIETKIMPSVVTVDAETTSSDTLGNPVTNRLVGTGWILDENGLIVTNNHVVEGATTVVVTLDDGHSYIARTVRTDPIEDIAVIDIDTANLQAVPIGDSSAITVGDFVIAIGNALGEKIEATQGVISDTGVTFTVDSRETLYNTLETTAQITYGYSGGPLVNMDGEVIGITSGATLTSTGKEVIGYAISSNTAKPVIQELIKDGCVNHAWLGVTAFSAVEFKTMGYDTVVDTGAYIIQVDDDSPADKCGLKAGDIIISLNDKVITTADDLVQTIRSSDVGQQMEITYWHDGTINDTDVTLVQNPIP